MATKRAKRIDPSEAFATIVGGGVSAEPEAAAATAEPLPAAAPTSPEQAMSQQMPQGVNAAPTSQIPAAAVPEATDFAPEAVFAPGAGQGSPAPNVPPGAAQAPGAASAPAPVPVPAPTSPPEHKLVQKGYYLYAEQARQLNVYAAVTGADKSSIVRAALSEYFENHPVS